ncbi:OmpA family protein [Jhaorihella thermophila]|uniref:Outer membrane protein OmpA n=1 Tax=Jhaorihella thermophila TaxID=488547 RepID=A0A1H5W980_9RHOB|nr:OmpA family protein [Jhaorihella thermophila]SEF96032.1 Outer membrane protein OmpA [Jhaorihella thermophila]
MKTIKISAALALSAALGLSACNDPAQLAVNTDPQKNTKQGAIAGGIIGAGLGAISGASNKTTAVLGGAAAGAILGGAIGASLDQQAAELRQQLASEGITVTNTGDRLVVSLPQDITFATDSFTVRDNLRPDLARLSQHLNKYPKSTVQVIGHTDSDGDAAYNQQLSERRAAAVAAELEQNGVSVYRIVTIGRGEEQPIASNLTEEGKARNRRVEIVIIPQK